MLSISSSFTPNLNHQSKNFPSLNPKCRYVLPKFSRKKIFSLPNLFKSIDDRISHLIDIPPSLDPGRILSSSFAPVDELPPTACEVVEGAIPSCLDGAYIRNGPNPHFLPGQGAYHLFDGDGMLHMIRISRGRTLFCSRYVKTYKYRVEEKYGYPIFPSVFSSFNGLGPSLMRIGLIFARVATGHFNPIANGFGTANTSIALIGGKLFALGESDLPYEIQVTPNGDIITLDRYNFGENIKPFLNMNAHPKIDPNTKETFSLRYHVDYHQHMGPDCLVANEIILKTRAKKVFYASLHARSIGLQKYLMCQGTFPKLQKLDNTFFSSPEYQQSAAC